MPTIFSHGIAAFALKKWILIDSESTRIMLLGVICSMIPDADTMGFAFGVPYSSLWGHRGFTHSFVFAGMLSLLVVGMFFRKKTPFKKEWYALLGYFFLATASHPFLDAMTNGGLGVAFFAPFDTTRYFFSWRPIKVSPIGTKAFFSTRGLKVIQSELLWIWLPSFIIIFASEMWKRVAKNLKGT